MDILKKSNEVYEYAVKVRRHLHMYPELSSCEFNTVRFIIGELDKLGIYYENIPDGGILGYIDGYCEGKTVLLRAECDALPIQESFYNANNLPKICVSKIDGVAHMCGHDSHVAMLLAAAKILVKSKSLLRGRVILLFERGEEGGYCIYYVLKHIQKNNIRIDSCWTNHIFNDIPVGQVAIYDGAIASGNFNFEIALAGKGGHGSRPDLSYNPIDCFAAIVNGMKDLHIRYIDPCSPLTYSIGTVHSGTKCNVIPETLIFAGTCRFHEKKSGEIFKEKLGKIVEGSAKLYDCKITDINMLGPCDPVVNHSQCVAVGRAAVGAVIGSDSVFHMKEMSMGSDPSFATLSS